MALCSLCAAGLSPAAGCVIPLPLEREALQDAGPNSIPVIVDIDSTYTPPGPVVIDTDFGTGEPQPMSLTVRDLDIEDDIHVYLYVDYNSPAGNFTAARDRCGSTDDQLDRTFTCSLSAVCPTDGTTDTEPRVLEAVVTDRERNDTGEPLFRSFPEDTGKSTQTWLLICQ